MTDSTLAFFSGVIVVIVVLVFCVSIEDPWNAGYCAAACGSAGVVEVLRKVCTCGPEEAPVAVRILRGGYGQ